MDEPVRLNFQSPTDLISGTPDWLKVVDCQEIIESCKAPEWQDKRWMENYELNQEEFGFTIFPQVESASEKPAVLIGGSPAIEKQTDVLKSLSDWFVVIACQRSLKFCIKNGIRVDYCMVVDAGDHIADDFDCETENITLIATPFTSHKALKRWNGNIFFYVPSGGVEYQKRIEKDFPPEYIDIGGGNVVSTAMLWAHKYLRIKHFVLTGMSLSYSNGYYVDGQQTDISNSDMRRFDGLSAIDIYGNIVKTTMPLLIYKMWMETYCKPMVEMSNGSVVNCTEDGILGVLPEVIEDFGDGRARLAPKYIPWMSITPLDVAVKAHLLRQETINGNR